MKRKFDMKEFTLIDGTKVFVDIGSVVTVRDIGESREVGITGIGNIHVAESVNDIVVAKSEIITS